MDIKALLPSTQVMEIRLPSPGKDPISGKDIPGEPTGIKLHLQGQDTAEFRTTAKAFAKRQLERKDKTLDFDEMEKERIELVTVCVVDWENLQEDGVDVPFSKAKAKELFSNPKLVFIVEQIEEFVAQRANFFRGTSK